MGDRPCASTGIPACASSVHAFAPEIARSFLGGLSAGDDTWVLELLRDSFLPWTELSSARPGYLVSLPKAAASVGPSRSRSRESGCFHATTAVIRGAFATGASVWGPRPWRIAQMTA